MKAIEPFIIPNFTIARMKARIDASVLMTTIILFTAATVLSFSTSQTYAQEDNYCDPSYPDVCISPPPPDLDCGDIPDNDFTVLAPDPHGLDSEGDGIGCEN
jgi:hypothetical protein